MKPHEHLHKASHHARLAKLHRDHADSLPDDHESVMLHRALAAEHDQEADFHRECAKTPNYPGEADFPRVAELRNAAMPDNIAGPGLIKDNPTRGRREGTIVYRDASVPRIEEIEAAELERLDPTLRKTVGI